MYIDRTYFGLFGALGIRTEQPRRSNSPHLAVEPVSPQPLEGPPFSGTGISRGPKGHVNIRISHAGCKAQYKGVQDPYVYVVFWGPNFVNRVAPEGKKARTGTRPGERKSCSWTLFAQMSAVPPNTTFQALSSMRPKRSMKLYGAYMHIITLGSSYYVHTVKLPEAFGRVQGFQ